MTEKRLEAKESAFVQMMHEIEIFRWHLLTIDCKTVSDALQKIEAATKGTQ